MRSLIASFAVLATLVSGGVAAADTLHAASAAARHTTRVVVRPVHGDGTPVAGWKVVRERIPAFTCNGGASTVAVDPNIVYCGFPSTNTVACWKSRNHTALCLRDPRVHKLYRIRYQGAFRPAKAVKHPSPQSFTLLGGGYCTIRDGGAWPTIKNHPRWYGTYGCGTKGGVYGRARDGIDRSVNPWRVHLVVNPNRPTIHNRRVGTAYYAGTAA